MPSNVLSSLTHGSGWKRRMNWKQWTSWIALALMLAGIVIYVATNDEAEPYAPLAPLDPAAAHSLGEDSSMDQPMPAAAE